MSPGSSFTPGDQRSVTSDPEIQHQFHEQIPPAPAADQTLAQHFCEVGHSSRKVRKEDQALTRLKLSKH